MNAKVLLLLWMAMTLGEATQPDRRSYFNYPDVLITVNAGIDDSDPTIKKAYRNLGRVDIPWGCGYPGTSTEPPSFCGFLITGTRTHPGDVTVSWTFVKKTETGDLYFFRINRGKEIIKEIPALYTGANITVYDDNGALVKIVADP